jgi:predicted small lipoprotein YifL
MRKVLAVAALLALAACGEKKTQAAPAADTAAAAPADTGMKADTSMARDTSHQM